MGYEMVEEKQAEQTTTTEQETTDIKEQAEAEVQADKTDETPKPGSPKYTQAVQERINQITREKHEARRDADRLKTENESLKRRLEAGSRPLPPDPSTFTSMETGHIDRDKYQRAMVDHEDKLHTWRQAQPGAAPTASKDEPSGASDGFRTFMQRAESTKQKHADFDEVINRPVFTSALKDAVFEIDQGPEIAYFLGKNEAEAMRIGDLPTAQMMREIGKLEAKLSAEASRRSVSGAPEPITPVTGADTVKKDPEKMSTEEWMSWNKQQQIERLKQQRLS